MGAMPGAVSTSAASSQDVLIRQLLAELQSAAASHPAQAANQRVHPRHPFHVRCEVRYEIAAQVVGACQGTTRDLSASGVGLLIPANLGRGTPVLVRFALNTGEQRHLTGTVTHSREVRAGWCLVGARFARLERDLLADSPPAAPPPAPPPAAEPPAAPRAFEELSGRKDALAFLAGLRGEWQTKERTARVLALARSSDHIVREAAVPVLVQLHKDSAVPALLERLHDPNAAIQGAAAAALGELHAQQAIPSLVNMLKSPSDDVALWAAHALGRLGDQRGLRVAARLLDGETPLGRRAARTLGIIVGREFRPNPEGVSAARSYVRENRIESRGAE